MKTQPKPDHKKAPDLLNALKNRPQKGSSPTASQIADEFEAEAKKLQRLADILRGKA